MNENQILSQIHSPDDVKQLECSFEFSPIGLSQGSTSNMAHCAPPSAHFR